ncbi:MAG: hypothetical protein GX790_05835 [Syntrophomonadaceae bacterium]|nr:hypothetical protein [Syntrophomonadaceae bacterium]
MLDLDFAFLNLINKDKKGLLSRKYFLERLTPIFFLPRLERLIDLRDIEAKGCNIIVPLGESNFELLNHELKEHLIKKSFNIINSYDIQYMAVDRNLKPQLGELANNYSVVFGDNFIKALANVLITDTLSKHEIKKIVLLGETEAFEDFLEVIAGYEVPLSIQNHNPHQYEIMVHRMLYEKGCAISNSYIVPNNWEIGDMIVSFDEAKGGLIVGSPSLYYLEFSNHSVNIAPDLESSLRVSGIPPSFHSLAPILETCLLTKAGFPGLNEEQDVSNQITSGKFFLKLQEVGDHLGIWDLFLDNGN